MSLPVETRPVAVSFPRIVFVGNHSTVAGITPVALRPVGTTGYS